MPKAWRGSNAKAIKRKIFTEILADLIHQDYEGDEWKLHEENITGEWRWGTEHETIVEHVPTGTFWSYTRRDSSGDSGEFGLSKYSSDYPGEHAELTRVSREPVTVWEWKVMYEGSD